jgi:OmcA/MtrC family decaheme c-type cytochrome
MADPESGNSIDMKQMIHKIHRGENLPSVEDGDNYFIVGYRDSVHDYSDVRFPQAMENCTTCHVGGEDSDHWKTQMSREACTSCHDRTSFESPAPAGFTLHTAGAVSDDDLCAGCHEEGRAHIGPYEVDVTKVHRPVTQFPLRDGSGATISEAPTVTGTIVDVTGTTPGMGQTPVVTFTLLVNDAPYDILANTDDTIRATFAAPTTDYEGYVQYNIQNGTSAGVGTVVAGANPGEWVWTAPVTIDAMGAAMATAVVGLPVELEGSMGVGLEGSLSRPATLPDGTSAGNVRYAMHNVVTYVALTDATAVPRREATTVENCNTCHEDLAAHGGSRNDPEYCVMCHNANRDTIGRMPAPAAGTLVRTTPLSLGHMIHRIHTGEHGENDYIAYTPSSPLDFSEVRFPGDRRNCEHCHVPGQYDLPLPDGLQPMRTSDIDSTRARDWNYYTGPTAAACTGCHDGDSTRSHALTMSIVIPAASGDPLDDPPDFQESCASCHAAGATFGIDVAHQRLGL